MVFYLRSTARAASTGGAGPVTAARRRRGGRRTAPRFAVVVTALFFACSVRADHRRDPVLVQRVELALELRRPVAPLVPHVLRTTPTLTKPLYASLEVAAIAMVGSPPVLGTLLALRPGAGARHGSAGVANVFMLTPLITPEIVTGVGLAAALHAASARQLSLTTVVLAHITFSISYVTVIVRARLAEAQPRGRGGGDGSRRHAGVRRCGW